VRRSVPVVMVVERGDAAVALCFFTVSSITLYCLSGKSDC
jgi:hypothetical protein